MQRVASEVLLGDGGWVLSLNRIRTDSTNQFRVVQIVKKKASVQPVTINEAFHESAEQSGDSCTSRFLNDTQESGKFSFD